MTATSRRVTIDPHHPTCRFPNGPREQLGRDPMRCEYCAALVRRDYAAAGFDLGLTAEEHGRDPLDYRYRGDDNA